MENKKAGPFEIVLRCMQIFLCVLCVVLIIYSEIKSLHLTRYALFCSLTASGIDYFRRRKNLSNFDKFGICLLAAGFIALGILFIR